MRHSQDDSFTYLGKPHEYQRRMLEESPSECSRPRRKSGHFLFSPQERINRACFLLITSVEEYHYRYIKLDGGIFVRAGQSFITFFVMCFLFYSPVTIRVSTFLR